MLKTINQYSTERQLSHVVIRRMIWDNRIPFYRFGRAIRVDPTELDKFFRREVRAERHQKVTANEDL